MKALRYILFSLLILAAIGLLCFYIFVEKDLSATNIVKCAMLILGAIASMLKTGRRRSPSNPKVTYQKAYGDFIRAAFSDEPKLEKKLYAAIGDYNQNKPAAALAKLQKLRKECQRTDDLYAVTFFMALCCDDMRLWDEAIGHYDAASKMRPHTTLFSNMGLCLQRLGKTEEAENAYKQALQLDPKNDYALTNLSSLCFREGDYEGALDYAEEALAINAQQPQALSTAAICCGIQGYEKEYIEYYRRAVAAGYDGNKIKYAIKQLDPFNS